MRGFVFSSSTEKIKNKVPFRFQRNKNKAKIIFIFRVSDDLKNINSTSLIEKML